MKIRAYLLVPFVAAGFIALSGCNTVAATDAPVAATDTRVVEADHCDRCPSGVKTVKTVHHVKHVTSCPTGQCR